MAVKLCDNRRVPDFSPYEGNPDFVLSLARGLAVIEAFEQRPDGVTVAGVASQTGFSRAAVRRLLMTLEFLGYANHQGSVYRLGTRVLRLGFSFLSSHSLASMALPILEEVSATIHESGSLSQWENGEIVYVARSAANRVMSVSLSVGSRLPAYCTSMGRVLLASLPEAELKRYLASTDLKKRTSRTLTSRRALTHEIRRVRQQGYSLVDEELEVGLRSIAVPVIDRSGRTVAAMNTGVHASRVSLGDLVKRLLPVLREGAVSLGQSLG